MAFGPHLPPSLPPCWRCGAAGGAQAQTYPLAAGHRDRPVPGRRLDRLARPHAGAEARAAAQGQTFVVENRPGGANVVAAVAVAKSPPDGHTLLMTTSTTMAINVSVFKNLAYDPAKDFVPVALVSGVPFVLVVNAGAAGEVDRRSGHATPRRNPAGSTYASTGAGSAAHLYMVLLQNALGIEMTADPLQGQRAGPAGHRRRPCVGDVLRPARRAAAYPQRQAARARRLDQGARAGGARPADAAGSRRDRLRRLRLADDRRAGEDAEGDRRPAQCRAQRHRARAAGQCATSTAAATSRSSRRRSAELQRFVQSEIVRWAKVVEQAGAKGTQ